MLDVDALSTMIADIVSEEVGKAVTPLHAKIAELEARPAGEPWEDIKRVVEIMISDALVTKAVGQSTVEKLISDGIANIEPAKEIARDELAALVNDAVAALPPAQDGKSVEIEQVLPVIAAEVAKAFEAYPVPKDGKPGRDGRGIKDLLIDREGHLIATMDDGTTKDLGHIIGKDGKDGQDGAPGFGLDDFDCTPIDERTIKMEFVRGEVKHSYELQFPVVVYRGVFKEGKQYERGDMTTWGGSLWHCDTPTKDKPGTESWTLAAKKGRDGKDGKGN